MPCRRSDIGVAMLFAAPCSPLHESAPLHAFAAPCGDCPAGAPSGVIFPMGILVASANGASMQCAWWRRAIATTLCQLPQLQSKADPVGLP